MAVRTQENLRHILEGCGLSDYEISRQLGAKVGLVCHHTTVCRWRHGALPTHLDQVALWVGASEQVLIFGSEADINDILQVAIDTNRFAPAS